MHAVLWFQVSLTQMIWAQSAGVVEYTNYISAEAWQLNECYRLDMTLSNQIVML